MSRKHVILVWVALALAVICQAILFAQAPTGSILGSVKDPSGAVVPNANVTIKNQNTNFKRSMPTNDMGDYQFTLVDAAIYTLSVEVAGFKKYVHPTECPVDSPSGLAGGRHRAGRADGGDGNRHGDGHTGEQ